MVLSLFQKEKKKVGFSFSSDICSLDILLRLMNGRPFSQGQGTFYYELGKMSAIDHCKRGAKRRCSLPALISTASAILPWETITRLCGSLHIMAETVLVESKKQFVWNLQCCVEMLHDCDVPRANRISVSKKISGFKAAVHETPIIFMYFSALLLRPQFLLPHSRPWAEQQ